MDNIITWQFWAILIASISLLWSIINTIVGKIIAAKITQNDLVHLTADVNKIETGEKDFKKSILSELKQIFKRLGAIERNFTAQKAVCNERHVRKR